MSFLFNPLNGELEKIEPKYISVDWFNVKDYMDGFILPRVILDGSNDKKEVRCNKRFYTLNGVSGRLFIEVGTTAAEARIRLSLVGQDYVTDAEITADPDIAGYVDVTLVEGGYVDFTVNRPPPPDWDGELWYSLTIENLDNASYPTVTSFDGDVAFDKWETV